VKMSIDKFSATSKLLSLVSRRASSKKRKRVIVRSRDFGKLGAIQDGRVARQVKGEYELVPSSRSSVRSSPGRLVSNPSDVVRKSVWGVC
jgi:hypothetical protein